jgi:hypothetical protein
MKIPYFRKRCLLFYILRRPIRLLVFITDIQCTSQWIQRLATAGRPWFDSWQGKEIVLFTASRRALGPTQPEESFLWEKRPWRETDHSPPVPQIEQISSSPSDRANLNHLMMAKVKKPSISECYTPSSEDFINSYVKYFKLIRFILIILLRKNVLKG